MTTPRRAGLLLAAAVLCGGPAGAQSRGQIAVTGIVTATPPALAAVGDLRFGVLRRGGVVTVDPRSSGYAAKLVVAGEPEIEFAIDFDLPEALVERDGEARLPVSFGPTGACIARSDDQRACAPFDPSGRLQPGGSDGYYIWLGGSIEAVPGARAGAYEGAVTATVQYTGV